MIGPCAWCGEPADEYDEDDDDEVDDDQDDELDLICSDCHQLKPAARVRACMKRMLKRAEERP